MFKRGHPPKKQEGPLGMLLLSWPVGWMDHIPLQKLLWSDGCSLLGSWAFGTTSACSECTVFPPGFAAAEHSSVVKCQQTSTTRIMWASSGQDVADGHGPQTVSGKACRGKEAEPLMQERIWTVSFDPGRNLSSLPSDDGLFIYSCVSKAPSKHTDITRKGNEDRVVRW